jgi:hypothetical protein
MTDSVKHWTDDVLPNPRMARADDRSCPACQEHLSRHRIYSHPNDCGHCPIAARSGHQYCRNTPYVSFVRDRTTKPLVDLTHQCLAEIDFLQAVADDCARKVKAEKEEKEKKKDAPPAKVVTTSSGEIQDAINLLSRAFTWSRTSEGHAYWSDIIDRLERIRDAGMKSKSP